jgi:diketogulonate reductase-like aldo/keto reductase
MAQGKDIVPIPGTKHVTYLVENLAAAHLALTDEELHLLAAIFDPGRISGGDMGRLRLNMSTGDLSEGGTLLRRLAHYSKYG